MMYCKREPCNPAGLSRNAKKCTLYSLQFLQVCYILQLTALLYFIVIDPGAKKKVVAGTDKSKSNLLAQPMLFCEKQWL